MGEDVAPLIHTLDSAGISYRAAQHENVAVAMADGYAWSSGGLGVAIVSRGPGLTNALSALTNAVKGRRAVLAISSDRSTDGGLGFDLAKHVAQKDLARSVGLSYQAPQTPDAAIEALHTACMSAFAGRPSLLAVPANIFRASGAIRRPMPVRLPIAPSPPRQPSQADADAIAASIVEAKRPLILAGRGALGPKTSAALAALGERIGALLGTSLLAKSLFRGHPLDVGVVGGFALESSRRLIAGVDCVLAFGASLNVFTRAHDTLFDGAHIIQIDTEAEQIGRFGRVDLGVVADAGATANHLLKMIGHTHGAYFNQPELRAAIAKRLVFPPGDESTPEHVDPRVLTVTLDELLPDDRIVVTDGGHQVSFTATALDVKAPGDLRLTPYDYGSLGMGLGVAIGAGLSRPARTTALFIGDGGMLMTLGDLASVAQLRIPLIIVVMNDRAYGSERHLLELEGAPYWHARFPDTDFAGIAAVVGIESATVRSVEALRELAPKLHSRKAPLLLDCKLNPDVRAGWLANLHARPPHLAPRTSPRLLGDTATSGHRRSPA